MGRLRELVSAEISGGITLPSVKEAVNPVSIIVFSFIDAVEQMVCCCGENNGDTKNRKEVSL